MNFADLVNPSLYMPHGCCYLWTPALIRMHVIGDLGAFFAYMSAPFLLGWLVRGRKDLPYSWIFLCFGGFIFFCGCMHLMEVITIWYPYYWIEGGIKLLTAIASVTTAYLLPGVVKKVLNLPTPEALARVNDDLAAANAALVSMTAELASARKSAEDDSQLKSQFLASISHEIRTPLARVLGMTELLLSSALDGSEMLLAQGIHDSAGALLVIINDLLDLSKIESGTIELFSEPFDVTRLTESVSILIAPTAKRKHIALTFDIDPALRDLVLLGDSARIKQILLNLSSNAVKFTDHGAVNIRVIWEDPGDSDNCRIKFSVQDTGIGLSTGARESIFQPFTQADGSTTRRYGGTGLGLSISKRLVDAMQGEMGVESAEGQGSIFWFVLDLPRSNLAAAATEHKHDSGMWQAIVSPVVPSDRPLADIPGRRILIVEDNPVLRELTIRRLARLNLAADAVASGVEAIEAASRTEYCLILMDCHMPQMDGYAATKLIRHCESATGKHVPIIAMTASNTPEAKEHCFASGMDDYMSKPFDLAALQEVLKRWLPA